MKRFLREAKSDVNLKYSSYLCGDDSGVVDGGDDGLDRVSVWLWSRYRWGHAAVYRGYR